MVKLFTRCVHPNEMEYETDNLWILNNQISFLGEFWKDIWFIYMVLSAWERAEGTYGVSSAISNFIFVMNASKEDHRGPNTTSGRDIRERILMQEYMTRYYFIRFTGFYPHLKPLALICSCSLFGAGTRHLKTDAVHKNNDLSR